MAWKNPRERVIDVLLTLELEHMAVDTAKLLALVEREKTENESLRQLARGWRDANIEVGKQLADANANIADLAAKLAAAIAANDGTALAAAQAQIADLQGQLTTAQADVDKATTDLNVDADATDALLKANTPDAPPADPAAAPAANPAP